MQSSHSTVAQDFYAVSCDVMSTQDAQPKAIALRSVGLNNPSSRAARNGQFSLQDRYKYFPVHFDNRSTSAYDVDAETTKAQYEVAIRFYNQSTITWEGVDVKFTYNGVNHTQSYSFDGTSVVDADAGIYRNTFTIDTSVLSGKFNWAAGKDRIRLVVTPKGEDVLSQPVSGKSLSEDFVALFDIQTLESAQSLDLCLNGYYGSAFSTFAQDGLIRSLAKASDTGLALRCSNSSLPFGGPMDVANLLQNTYRHGQTLKVRTLNESSSAQDNYDGSSAALRRQDIQDYMDFSAAALAISQITSEEIGGFPTDKKKIFDFCRPTGNDPKYPCDDNTQFADLDHDMVLKICQWYSASGSEVDGCPSDVLGPAIRFAKWTKQNAQELSALRGLLLQPSLSSGKHFNSNYQAMQQAAIVFGVWPDGKPIWDLSTAGTELTNKRLLTCHEKSKGCEYLKSSFKNDKAYMDSMGLQSGWEL